MPGWLPAVAAATTGIQVGAAIVATRYVIDQTHPASLALMRYAIGSICFLPPLLMSRRTRFERRDLAPLALLGITQFGILIALLNFGLNYMPAARAALIFATFPLLTMILAFLLGQERLNATKALGVLLTIGGVGLALGEKAIKGGGANEWLGALAVLAGALCARLGRIFGRAYRRRRLLRRVAPLYPGRLAGDRLHRDWQRRRLLSLALGVEPCDGDARHRVSRA